MINQSAYVRSATGHPRRWFLLGIGYLSFATGFVGMFLPLLPTTVFWIIAAICFAKSSPSMYRRIISWPGLGPVIGDFLDHGVIGRRSKTISLVGMALASAVILFIGIGVPATSAALIGISGAAYYVTTRPANPRSAEFDD